MTGVEQYCLSQGELPVHGCAGTSKNHGAARRKASYTSARDWKPDHLAGMLP